MSFTHPTFGFEEAPNPPDPTPLTPPNSASTTGEWNFQFQLPRAAYQHALNKVLKQNEQADDDQTGDYNPQLENLQERRRRKRVADQAAKRAQERFARERERGLGGFGGVEERPRARDRSRTRSRSPEGLFTEDTAQETGAEEFDRGRERRRHSDYHRSSRHRHRERPNRRRRHHRRRDPLTLTLASESDSDSDVEVVSSSTPISPTPDPDPSRWGRWGRPIHFAFKPSFRRKKSCQFHAHPMRGHPVPQTENDGRRSDYMCFDCTIERVAIGSCPHKTFRRANEGVDFEKAYKRLSKGKARPGVLLCAICTSCADFECRDRFHCKQGSRQEVGCGLALCEVCFGKFGKEFKGDLDRMLAEGRFEDEEYPIGVRADSGFLSMSGGALARQAVDQGVF